MKSDRLDEFCFTSTQTVLSINGTSNALARIDPSKLSAEPISIPFLF